MSDLIPQLIATAIVGAIAPAQLLVVITLLMSKNGLAKAVAYTGAVVAAYAVIGVIALTASNTSSGTGPKAPLVTGTIIAVVGGLLVIMAVKEIVEAPDPDATPPKLMTTLDTMSVPAAFGFGVPMALINVKQLGIYLAGVAQIVNSDVSSAQAWLALVILVVVIQIGLLAVVIADLVAKDWASRTLHTFSVWLVLNNRVISIILGLVIGAWFTVKGISQIASA